MNWEKFECEDDECRLTHLRYYDEATDEVVGMVSGPTRLRSYIVDYKGETIGEFRSSTAAMGMLERNHSQELQAAEDRRVARQEAKEFKSKLISALGTQGIPDPGAFLSTVLPTVQQLVSGDN